MMWWAVREHFFIPTQSNEYYFLWSSHGDAWYAWLLGNHADHSSSFPGPFPGVNKGQNLADDYAVIGYQNVLILHF